MAKYKRLGLDDRVQIQVLTKRGISDALAGVPRLTWRVSATRCQRIPAKGFPGFYYRMFLLVRKALAKPPRKADQAVEQARKYLLKLPPKRDSTIDYLRDNFYFLRTAIESTYKNKPLRQAVSAVHRGAERFRRAFGDSLRNQVSPCVDCVGNRPSRACPFVNREPSHAYGVSHPSRLDVFCLPRDTTAHGIFIKFADKSSPDQNIKVIRFW